MVLDFSEQSRNDFILSSCIQIDKIIETSSIKVQNSDVIELHLEVDKHAHL